MVMKAEMRSRRQTGMRGGLPSVASLPFGIHQMEQAKDCLVRYGKAYRYHLLEQGAIHCINETEYRQPWYLLAVDSASYSVVLGGGVHLLLSGVCNDLEKVIVQEAKTYIFPHNRYTGGFSSLTRLAMELEIIARLPLVMNTYVILDHSFNQLPIELNHILYEMISYHKDVWGREENNFYQVWLNLIEQTFGVNGYYLKVMQERRIIAVSKLNTSQIIVQDFQRFMEQRGESSSMLHSIDSLSDKALMQCILEPGEYLRPRPSELKEKKTVHRVDIFRHSYKHIVNFMSLENEFRNHQVMTTYFMPSRNAFVQRIEFFADNDIHDILSTVKYYCLPDIPEILQQARADEYAKLSLAHFREKHTEGLMSLVRNASSLEEGNLYKLLLSKQRS